MGISQAAGTPTPSPIGALKYTAISPCINDACICGIDGQGMNIEVSQAAAHGTPVGYLICVLIYTVAISTCINDT